MLEQIMGNLKTYAIIAGAVILVCIATYFKGHSDGWTESDNKWKVAIAESKPHEVARDTVYIKAKPTNGTYEVETLVAQKYQKRIDSVLAVAKAEAIIDWTTSQSEADSLRQINTKLAM